ncbi:Spore germination protein GerPC [Oceanobacillus limi]|uniref:Spore germination protein GerPC n=1 Tax=Oceanobacillus limi TaxID=930131 RepID=A0A1I0FAG8_9BACI|nr:spore germination protein GerPC [Oceanobacillus limi]SET55204.1 Spore germination protein GerPC [Oceanobacillus limi]
MSQNKTYYPYPLYRYYPLPFYETYYQNPIFHMPQQQSKEIDSKQLPKEEVEPNTVMEHLEKIYDKLNKLEEENKQMKDELASKKTINVENVNYKIQDLHVEDLSGALLVGLTSWSDAEELQELLSQNGPVMFNDINTDEMQNAMMNQQNEEKETDADVQE